MSNKRKNRKTRRGVKNGILSRAFTQTKLAANVTEEQDWYLDTPDVRLTRIFAVVLILHVVAVGGILAFKMIDKASADNGAQLASTSKIPESAATHQLTLAGKTQGNHTEDSITSVTRNEIASPLKRDPAKDNQYRVLAGDTLSEIAKSLGIDPAALRAENAIQSDHELYPGRWLDIPEKEKAAVNRDGTSALPEPTAARPEKQAATPVGNSDVSAAKVYQVQSGDTVWGIARKFSVSYQELISVNLIDNPQGLQIGQKLNIPTGE